METVKLIRCTKSINFLQFSVRKYSLSVRDAVSGTEGFLQDYEHCHLATSQFQKALLGFGSAVVSIADPRRGDMIAAMGETTGRTSLEFVKNRMLQSSEGKRILQEKPRINSTSVNLSQLSQLPEGTVGKTYANFMRKYGYSPDERLAVRFVDDIELAYIIQRYREVHDLFHTILKMPTNMLGEVTVKWVEAIQTRLPMCIGGAVFGAARLAPKYSIRAYSTQREIEPTDKGGRLPNQSYADIKHKGAMKMPCVSLPDYVERTVLTVLKDRNIPDVQEKGKAITNYLHSRKPPCSDDERKSIRKKLLKEVIDKMQIPENMSQEQIEYTREKANEKVNNLMWRRIYNWKPLTMSDSLGYGYLLARAPAEFAVLVRACNEILKRDSHYAPKSVFDFGSGVGTVAWAAHSIWGSSLREYFTVDSSPYMNELALLILQENDAQRKPFVRELYQRQFLPATPRQYDIVVSAYSLFELDSTLNRLETLNNLWCKTKDYMILIEQGTNAGFKIIQEARDFILHLAATKNEDCHVFAPCPHEKLCPVMSNMKTPCNFKVRYFPLKFNGDGQEPRSELFSYVILKKAKRDVTDEPESRIIREVLKRHKHVICRLCTPQGTNDEIIISPGKYGKDKYKSARLSSWGDRLPAYLTNKDEENR